MVRPASSPMSLSMSHPGGSGSEQHPLSPGLGTHPAFPSLARRSSSFVSLGQAGSAQGPSEYFDQKHSLGFPAGSSLNGRRRQTMSDAELLGVGPSQKLARRGQASSRAKASPAIRHEGVLEEALEPGDAGDVDDEEPETAAELATGELDRAELDVLETRFDLMTDLELRIYLDAFTQSLGPKLPDDDPPPVSTPSASTPASGQSPSRTPIAAGRLSTGRESPLFPPSPPTLAQHRDAVEHPLRLFSRTVRALSEQVRRLELENAALRAELSQASDLQRSPPTKGDRAKLNQDERATLIRDDLSEALSTSLPAPTIVPQPPVLAAEHKRPPSRASSRSRRARSPPPGSTVAPGSQSIRSVDAISEARVSGSANAAARRKDRASWTAGLWGWGQKKSKRQGSGSSAASHPVNGRFASLDIPESAVVDEEDENAWRNGDGGSSPAFRAIFLATRILTPDPTSILSASTIGPSSLVANLAHALVDRARDEGIVPRDPPGRRRSSREQRSRSRAASIVSQDTLASASAAAATSTPAKEVKGYGDQALAATALIGRSIISSVSSVSGGGGGGVGGSASRSRSTAPPPLADDTIRPALLNRASSSRPYPTTAVTPVTQHGSASGDQTPPPSVELSSIVPDEARPPTVLLSRQNLGSFFQSSKAVPTLRTATRFNSKDPPLTDRYGFIYDVQHASMLKDASAAKTAAPASLHGTVPASREEGWIESRRKKAAKETKPIITRHPSDEPADVPSPRRSIDSSSTHSRARTPDSSRAPHPAGEHRHRSSTLSLNPSPARPITAKETLTVSARGSSSLQTNVASPSLSAGLSHPTVPLTESDDTAQASRLTVSSLLDQLTDMHDLQQKERLAEWDAFLRKRLKSKGGKGVEGRSGEALMGLAQLSPKKHPEEWKAFTRLLRRGIPLVYRPEIWAEFSGARDALVPGEYAEILAVHANDISPVLAEIEKDVSRTFPGNLFFGGDGPGVAKLRRVLVAYSWHNPAVGYCQGMNMLAATLLLTHEDEEQAYWVLASVIDRLLPKDFFSPSLIASRADQLVLEDLVSQALPKVHAHLEELGIELASITFGWWLSLFTDCLPVETLFRVWDVFFIEGHDVLFRVAMAILKMAEPDLLACDNVPDLFAFIGGMTSRLWAADKLIALQHSFKPVMSHGDLLGLREGHAAVLRAQIEGAA